MLKLIGHAALPCLLASACAASELETDPEQTRPLTGADLEFAAGDWTGALSYLDFTSGEQVAIPIDLEITRDGTCLDLVYRFPEEPQANSTERKCIGEDGLSFDGKPVTQVGDLETGASFELEYAGEDNGEPAEKREVYQLSDDSFQTRTEFRRAANAPWTVRNTIVVARREPN